MEAIHLVEDLVGRKAILDVRPAHPADAPATWADIGAAALADWYRDNRGWAWDVTTR